MGRMLTTRALQPPEKRPAAPTSKFSPPAVTAPAARPAPSAESPVGDASLHVGVMNRFGFYFGLALVFVQFGVVPEVLYTILHVNTYLIYVVAPGAVVGALLNGGFRRTFQNRAAWYWIAFYLWLLVGIPFSYWRGGSTGLFYDYSRVSMPLLLVVGGLATNWKEVRAIFYAIAAAGSFNLLTARIFAKEENGRLNMFEGGTISNSNDLAAHLIMVLPFLLYVAMDRKRNAVIRLAMIPLMVYGLSIILGTASRGGLIALGAIFAFMILRATPTQRITALVAGVVLAALSFVLLPPAALNRLGSLFGGQHEEAEESSDARGYLFRTSLQYTFQHPVFGVGLGQFPNYEGKTSVDSGKLGNWHATHCSWTQVSSECGVPAFLFFVLGLGSATLLVHRTWRQARARKLKDISNACFCYLLAMLGFLTAITFLANAYRFYLPAMVGLAISIHFVAKRQMSADVNRDQRTAGIVPHQAIAAH